MNLNGKNMAIPSMKREMSMIAGPNPNQPYPFQSPPSIDPIDRSMAVPSKEPFESACTSTGLYLMKEQPDPMTVSGSANLLSHFGLEATYNKFCGGKKVKETLSSFLPDLPGYIDTVGMQDNSSLNALIERPPLVGSKEIQPLSQSLLSSFRLHLGPLPAQYKAMYQSIDSTRRKNKHHKKHRSSQPHDSHTNDSEEYEHKKHKKKKHEDSEKRKKKKEKKKKKERDRDRN